jgi:hypothetical protein
MCYSRGMNAPDISKNYPSKGRKIGPAWADVWDALTGAGRDWTDGVVLAETVAAKHPVSPDTLRNILHSAKRAGLLEIRHVAVTATAGRGSRLRTHYRIASLEVDDAES